MGKIVEHKGLWWTPSNPDRRLHGTLTVSPVEGAHLEVMAPDRCAVHGGVLQLSGIRGEIILGESSEGEDVTLHGCFRTETRFGSSGFPTSLYYVDTVFLGAHFHTPEEIKFNNLSIQFTHLDQWVGISGFDLNMQENLSQWFKTKEFVIKYKHPGTIAAYIGEGLEVAIDFAINLPTDTIVQTEATIRQKAYVRIKYSQQKSFGEFSEVMLRIQELLTLGVTRPVYPFTIKGETEANKIVNADKVYYHPVEVFVPLREMPDLSTVAIPFDMLFRFSDIQERFESVLKTWFEKAGSLKPTFDLYFSTLYNPKAYTSQKFLSLVQAVEVYHRRTIDGLGIPEDRYKDTKDKILQTVPTPDKEWWERKVNPRISEVASV